MRLKKIYTILFINFKKIIIKKVHINLLNLCVNYLTKIRSEMFSFTFYLKKFFYFFNKKYKFIFSLDYYLSLLTDNSSFILNLIIRIHMEFILFMLMFIFIGVGPRFSLLMRFIILVFLEIPSIKKKISYMLLYVSTLIILQLFTIEYFIDNRDSTPEVEYVPMSNDESRFICYFLAFSVGFTAGTATTYLISSNTVKYIFGQIATNPDLSESSRAHIAMYLDHIDKFGFHYDSYLYVPSYCVGLLTGTLMCFYVWKHYDPVENF